MKKTSQQLIVFSLMLLMVSSLFPIDFFHHHDDHSHSHCDKNDLALESDPCHITIYHGHSVKNTCEHNSHLTESEEECEICKYITTNRVVFTTYSDTEVHSIKPSIEFSLALAPTWVWNSSLSIKGRAPPMV